jgi:hypothetical protein
MKTNYAGVQKGSRRTTAERWTFLFWTVALGAVIFSVFALGRIRAGEKQLRDLNAIVVNGRRDVAAQISRPGPGVISDSPAVDRSAVRAHLIELESWMSIDRGYGDLFQLLKLSDDRLRRVRALLVKRRQLIDAAFRDRRRRAAGLDNPADWPAVSRAAAASLDGEFEQELGAEGFRSLQDYNETRWLRPWLQKADLMLRAEGAALSAENREKLVTLLEAVNRERTAYPTISEDVLRQAVGFLNTSEMAVMKSLAEELHGRATLFEAAREQLLRPGGP